ncbi:AsnC family transcriptional regulator [Candidatus Woesearchaeota archaeon]|jgi:DNA-binding Lrp family transcriptional regulator|nr:AsnC family transcriptional regulator [Candidatus Woesearchaeota archaeon]MBT4321937.1 AsnC family transcriptional regulator [Candidatus Woesearchaeota archaeon]MBT4631289.1 AsnC family transcriptional regulator [Candidatus Woesearchaeota archaeon]
MKLDIVDKKILTELELNSSIHLNKLAKKVNKSPETTSYRIQRLKEEGILNRTHLIADMSKFGYTTFRVYIKWQYMTLQDKSDFYTYLKQIPQIWTTAQLHGKWDLGFFVGIKHSKEFKKIWNQIEALYKEKIAEYKIAIYSLVHNFNKTFLLDNFDCILQRSSGEQLEIPHDETDENIIYTYGKDVRQPLHKVAKEVGVSIETVRKRIKRLEREGVIVGYKTDMDLSKLGYQGYRVDFYLKSTKRNKEIFEYLKNHKNFYQINESIGGADIETEIIIENLVLLLEELEKIVKRFKDVIKYFEHYGYTGFPSLSIVAD